MLNKMLSRDFLNERLVPELEIDTVQYFDHLRRYLFAQEYASQRQILDIACGTGYGSDILQRGGAKQVIGMDISFEALTYASQHWARKSFVQADACRLPLSAGAVDLIVSFETLEHLPEPQAFLAEARRVLRQNGYLILSTPNRSVASPGSDVPYSPYHAFEPTRTELVSLLEQAGWKVVELRGMTHSPQAQAVIRPAQGPFRRETVQGIAWPAYIRLWLRALLPLFIYEWLGRRRAVPSLSMADSVVMREASDQSSYFIAVCTPKTDRR